jgi:hypothetical protein
MAKVSESPYGMSESYTVKFWHTNEDGYYRQIEETLYSNSKCAHDDVETFAKNNLGKFYKNFRVISVAYQ